MAGPSAEDLEEIAEGKASSRDKAEAGVASVAVARAKLRAMHGRKTTTRHRKTRKRTYR